jgi:ELWxxDGT repeat protein
MLLFRRRSLFAAVLAASATVATAQPFLVADLAPPEPEPLLSMPRALHGFGPAAVFVAGSDYETDLWRTDGTAAGTRMLLDVCPELCEEPVLLAALVGHLFFSADLAGLPFVPPFDSGPRPTWLVRTDGTVEGTVALGGPFDHLEWLGNAGEVALFAFLRQTSAGSRSGLLAADLDGEAPTMAVELGHVVSGAESEGRVYFSTLDELWLTDGTEAGTRRLDEKPCWTLEAVAAGVVCWDFGNDLFRSDGGRLQLLAQVPASRRLPLAAADGTGRTFYAFRPESGHELWVTDGTSGGTRRLNAPAAIDELAAHGGRAYFSAVDAFGSEPWISDGTPLGTRRLADLCPGPCSSTPIWLSPHGDGMLLAARGEPESRRLLWHVGPGAAPPRRLLDAPLTGAVSVLQVEAKSYVGWNYRLWRIDRSLAVHDLGLRGSTALAAAGPWVLFSRDGELWRTDGTLAGTSPVAAVERAPGSDPHSLVELDGRLCFLASGAPWCTGPGGVEKLAWDDGVVADWLTTAAGKLFIGGRSGFSAYPDLAAPPVQLRPFAPFAPFLPYTAEMDGVLYFFTSGDDGALWRSDGTVAGTRQVAELGGRALGPPIGFGGRLLFLTDGGASEVLWSSDGTPEGTFVLHDEPAVSRSLRLARFGNAVWFTAGRQLWRTDGMPSGTHPVFDLGWFADPPQGPQLVPLPGRLLIVGWLPHPAGAEVWSTDGDSPPEKIDIPLGGITTGAIVGNRLFYLSGGGRDRPRLVSTDGTTAGTRSVELPGVGQARPDHLTAIDGRVVFAAHDLAHGSELWISDGTDEGTRRLFDLAPGPASSLPEHMTRVDDLLYFVADDGRTGRELWAVPWEQVLGGGSCEPSATRLCLGDGRFAVTVRWRDPYNGGEGSGRAVPIPGSDATGTFWFFDPGNVELIVKALDGRVLNGHRWLFYGALTTVEYWIDVLDTQTGETRRYHNPPGEQCGRGDTTAFAGAAFEAAFEAAPAASAIARRPAAAPAAAGCDGATTLCFLGGSLAVEVDWHDPRSGNSGHGVPIGGSDNTGYFWFFDPANVELVVKALDGTAVNGHRWVFYGGLSDVEYEIRVTEVATGASRTYRNPFGEICGGSDTAAF